MSRRENGSLYVPVGVPREKTFYEKLSEKYMLPPLKEILRSIAYGAALFAVIAVILLISGLRFKVYESDTGLTYRYFGFMVGGKPTAGTLSVSDGTRAKFKRGDIYYSDGSVYEGDILGFMKHGEGTLEFEDGSEYEGEFINDTYSGNGKFTKKDGSYYEGGYKNGLYHGEGVLNVAGLGCYTGEFSKGEKNGEGSFVYENGDTFKGTYKNDIRTNGVYTWKDGDSIEGNFVGNMPSATEKLIYTDRNGRTFKVYFDYVYSSLEDKKAYVRPAEPEPEEGPEENDGSVG